MTSKPTQQSPDGSEQRVHDDEALGYEEARDQLIAVVQQLESGSATLQEAVELWERGERLADICQRWLDGARARLDAATSAEPSKTDR
jgi:exodeoxyribonuclease VII small subunit